MTLDRTAQDLAALIQQYQTVRQATAPSGGRAGTTISLRLNGRPVRARCLSAIAPGPVIAVLLSSGWGCIPVAATRLAAERQVEFRQRRPSGDFFADIDLGFIRRAPTYPNDAIYAIGIDPFKEILINPVESSRPSNLEFGYGGPGQKWAASVFNDELGLLKFQVKKEEVIDFGNTGIGDVEVLRDFRITRHHLVSGISGDYYKLYWNDGSSYELLRDVGGTPEVLLFPGILAPAGPVDGIPNQYVSRYLYDDTRLKALRLLDELPEVLPFTNVEYRDGSGAIQTLDASGATLSTLLGLNQSGANTYIHPYIYSIPALESVGSIGEANFRKSRGIVTVYVNFVDLVAGTITLERSLSANYIGKADETYTPLAAVYYPPT